MIRVLVVDDHPLVRAVVSLILRQAAEIDVVGQCADGAEVPRMAALVRPDVVLMDVQMPLTCGPDATRYLLARQPAIRVIMLTGSITSGALLDAAQAGAVGYLLKSGNPDLMVEAVRTVAAGGTAWPGDGTRPVATA